MLHYSPSGSPQFNVVVEIVFMLFDSKICIFVGKNWFMNISALRCVGELLVSQGGKNVQLV